MTTPYPAAASEPPRRSIAAGMAAGDTDAVMRAVAASEVVVPQAPGAGETDLPDGSISLPVIEQDGTSYVPVFTSEATMASAAPGHRGRRAGQRRRARRQLALGRPLARREPRHRGRPHAAAGRRPLAADLHRRRAHRLSPRPLRDPHRIGTTSV